jgi:DNA repair protein RadD
MRFFASIGGRAMTPEVAARIAQIVDGPRPPQFGGWQGRLFATASAEMRPLRPYQETAIAMVWEAIRRGKMRPIIELPTGAGKTRVAAAIIRRALVKNKRVYFVVPVLSLIDQTITAFEQEGISDIGVMQGAHPRTDPEAAVQICTCQTLIRREIRKRDLVIVDECHLQFEKIREWLGDPAWERVPFIGLSATPWSKGLGRHFDALLRPVSMLQLIDQGYLSKFKIFAPPGPDVSAVRTSAGDYREDDLSNAVDRPELHADIVKTWLTRAERRPTILYAVDRAHAAHLEARFAEAGVRTTYLDCYTERSEREIIFDRFRRGQIDVICNVATLTTGIDLDVRCIIDARPTKSEIRFVQTLGRGLRPAPGKDDCLILDHAGNHHRFGLVTEIGEGRDVLDDGKQRQARSAKGDDSTKSRVRACKSCSFVLGCNDAKCPICGSAAERVSSIFEKDGELVELGSPAVAGPSNGLSVQIEFIAQLRDYAIAHRYRAGWVSHQFRHRFGFWSTAQEVLSAEPTACGLKVRNWIKARQIAFAKGQAYDG